jgi:AcrR family transcriptional regulator
LAAAKRRRSEVARAASRSREAEKKRPAKAPSRAQRATLSREAILGAALHIADRDGLGGLTMRKIAGHLGASPMGVYRHFRNKAEIVGGLVDLVVGRYDVTNHDEPSWTEWVRETFLQMKHALCAHPGIIPLLGATAFWGTNALGVLERVLHVLRGAGLGEASVPLFHALMSYTIGAVAIESSALSQATGERGLDSEEQLRRARLFFELAARSTYPNVVASAPELARFSTGDQFVNGLDRILSSVSIEQGEHDASPR